MTIHLEYLCENISEKKTSYIRRPSDQISDAGVITSIASSGADHLHISLGILSNDSDTLTEPPKSDKRGSQEGESITLL